MRAWFALLLLAGGLFQAQSQPGPAWPGQWNRLSRTSLERVANLPDQDVWNEYGLEAVTRAVYGQGASPVTITAYRFKDPTGSLAAFQWQRPDDSRTTGTELARYAGGQLVRFENYLLRFEGGQPTAADVTALTKALDQVDRTALPSLPNYLPKQDRVANSERYVLGPRSLAHFAAGLPVQANDFSAGVEAQIARFRARAGEVTLGLLTFPTPQMARERQAAFEASAPGRVRRSGPLLGVALSAADAAAAEQVLKQIQYQAAITVSDVPPPKDINAGDLLIQIFTLAGVLIGFCVLAGLLFAGIRYLSRKLDPKHADETMIVLGLRDR